MRARPRLSLPSSQRPRRRALATGVLLAIGLPLVVAPPAAGADDDAPARSVAPGRPPTATYSNPLAPVVPGGGTVDSCADPTVIRGQQAGDDDWYMYCTTDPLNDDDRGPDGDLQFRKVPQLRSNDLVTWEYEGAAFTENPSWAAETAALWAPDVVYSQTFDRYYLFVTVTDTDVSLSGEEGCTSDSAIGVATSTSPTGPWEFADEPVVGPRRAGEGCNFFWTYDPDVLGDTVGTDSTVYYGSYFGGLFGAPITFTADGATAVTDQAVQVTIGNRYEGPNVVERDGWYYLFVSATNCCAGALTGYSVFAARSRDPLGPFVDREGASLLDSRVGGTPVISMNGNRWVGTGHNSVFTDAAGQWWTAYHAVDQGDPFFEGEPGFTKRPVLLDPVDWVDGWPTVNGGRWASDQRMRAPAAQDGQRSLHRTRLVEPLVPGREIVGASDGFEGDELSKDWTWVREPGAGSYEVTDGVLRWQTQAADLYVDNNSASVLTREAPAGDYVVQTRVRVDVPAEGCCFNYVQAGLVLHGDDDNYIKLTSASIWETRQTEFAKELAPVPDGWNRYGNTVVGAPGDWTHLRVVVERLSGREQREAGGDTERYTAFTSADGVDWVRGGAWTHSLDDARIGLVSMGGSGFTAEFDDVTTYRLRGGGHG